MIEFMNEVVKVSGAWLIGLLEIGIIGGFIALIYQAWKHNPFVQTYWKELAMPLVVFLLIHLSIWVIWPVFWWHWSHERGFLVLQCVMIAGFYAISLSPSNKQAVVLGWIAVAIAGLGLTMTMYGGYKLASNTNPLATIQNAVTPTSAPAPTSVTTNVVAPVGGWSPRISTPGRFDLTFDESVKVQFFEMDKGANKLVEKGEPFLWTGGTLGVTDAVAFQAPLTYPVKGKVTVW